MSGVLPAGLSLIVDDAPRLSTSAAERVLAEVDDERRRRLVASLQKALRNRRKKDNKKAAKSRATATTGLYYSCHCLDDRGRSSSTPYP